ncbi:glycosyltransferase family 2 protein [Selenomonas ruminantium]|uniref:glycosyltransferase family 2 protein n=1 Tax=Selenomonas ruminantium TaxID=971 RepID=UPI0004146F1A|nr:glycosyltransferase family 2 protein [Selenomonas ruminantium]
MLLSVLVPVYNVEKFLKRCIYSLIEMPVIDYEVILVDDGSTDSSGDICDSLEQQYSWIRVIHQRHRGLVAARDAALAVAGGKYITFVDSDDWVDRELLPSLVLDLEKYDDVDIAVGCVVRNVDEKVSRPYLSRLSEKMSVEQAMIAMVNKEGMHWYLWGKVYRRHLFKNQNMDIAVTVFEDLDRIWNVLKHTRNIYFDNKYSYHYFVNANGMTEKRCDLNLSSWRVFERIILDSPMINIKQKMINFYFQIFLRHILEMYFADCVIFQEQIKKYIAELKNTLTECNGMQNIMPKEIYMAVTNDYNTCVSFLDNTFYEIKKQLNDISGSTCDIYVYGTGIVAQYISFIMKDIGIVPRAFVVSDNQIKYPKFEGRPVIYLSNVKKYSDAIFVLALSGKSQTVVFEMLKKKTLAKIVTLNFPPIVF